MLYDCIIVGSGIGGVSAALTLKANNVNFLLLGQSTLSAKIGKAEKIRNYPGLTDISGADFVAALQNQLKAAEISVTEARVTGVYSMKDKFSLLCEGGAMYEGKTVILTTGVETFRPIKGEEDFVGRGVSYCATCDGFLYKGKRIAVFSSAKHFEREVNYLADLAEKVYFIPMYKNESIEKDNVEKIVKMPTSIEGEKRVEKICFGEDFREVDGVFMLKESISPAVLVAGLKTENGHIVVGRDMATNLKGCFAAGDCTGRPYQYAKAVGEGNVAAHSVLDYLG